MTKSEPYRGKPVANREAAPDMGPTGESDLGEAAVPGDGTAD